jgi:hypothetical protein
MLKEVLVKKSKKASGSTSQKTFNRLRKQLENLQEDIEDHRNFLDRCLDYYRENIYSFKNTYRTAASNLVKIFYGYYNQPKVLTAKEKKTLKETILVKAEDILNMGGLQESDPEILEIYEELNDVPYKEELVSEFGDLKTTMEAMFKEQGIDVDFSHIDPNDTMENIQKKMFESIFGSLNNFASEERGHDSKPKSKKELAKEQKVKDLEEIQKKGLSTIYKQLAKALHPDLEPDISEKAKKVELMKQLTIAYENKDLHTILKLEMEWMNRAEEENLFRAEDQLKIYNGILKDQIETLKEDIEAIIFEPQYRMIMPFQDEMYDGGLLFFMKMHGELKQTVKETKRLSEDLSSAKGLQILKTTLKNL